MTDHAELRRLAEQASSGNWYGEDSQVLIGKHAVAYCNHKVDAQFIGKANPKTVLALLDEIDRLKAENYAYKDRQKRYEWLAEDLKECASALPGTEYMDPPDGGNVSIPEQIRRMAKDAARYRGLRDEGYLHNWASLHVCDEHLRAQRTDEAIDSVLNIGATQ
ncbi:TPA: ead/Ea22-like family protein [Pseudomonas aeruginosa]|nr:ead/Ea22-like family protein [Pseudomonas aeruginosa]